MPSRQLRRLALATVLIGGIAALAASTAEARPAVRRSARARVSGFNLFAGAVNVMMNVNRVQCNINAIGETCVDPTNSPVLGGGFWPKGTPDQYIFNSGLQIAGIIPTTAGFGWAGDTVGAFFFDPRGDQAHGEGRTNVFNALNADDLANWPSAAYVRDTSLFNAALIGRQTVSQQDTWVRYWDGNTALTTGRKHPMGLLVEQRGLMWNFPSGNEDIVFFLYRFINITARTRSTYDGLADAGYAAADIDEIAAIANDFQDRAEESFAVSIPDAGYTISNVFAAFAQDPDVGQAGSNYSTAVLPFAIAAAYKSDFREPTWAFPPSIFGAPFAAAPGFEGVKYLKSPRNLGISMFTNTTNGAPFNDARGVSQLWRYLSGNTSTALGDFACSVTSPQARHLCGLAQTVQDTRFMESSGPFSLAPGESEVIVVAYVHAAPVASAIAPFIGGDMKPGIPIAGDRLVTGADTVRNVDRAMGWVSHSDVNSNGIIEQSEVVTVPRSLLHKSLVAQAVFDNKFLLPFAPEPPLFFAVPGDGQVTITWQATPTLTAGDPFFAVASNTASPLYDRNFRRLDVEGYRIWRGRTEATMEVIASFDDAGSTITDYTGQFFNDSYGNQCAPELGVTASCPTLPNDITLIGNVIQVPPGGRVELADGTIFIVTADTALTGGASGLPALQDNGVPFAFIDRNVRNGFRYFYAVTAFDVNSVASGPSSLGSPLITKTATPRATASTAVSAVIVTGVFGGDGTELDPNAPFPTIDATNGTFSGPIPPADAGNFGFLASVAEALPTGDFTARIDSIAAGFIGGIGEGPILHMTLSAPGVTQRIALPLEDPPGSSALPAFNSAATAEHAFELSTPLVPYDTARARRLGIPLSFSSTARMPVEFSGAIGSINQMSMGTALSQGRYGAGDQPSRYLSHSRWFDESAGVEPPNPTITFAPSRAQNSGSLTGVDSIWAPTLYRNPTNAAAGAGGPTRIHVYFRGWIYSLTSWYPADFVVTWAAGGSITVRDSTHRTNLPFNAAMGSGYGFVSLANMATAGVTAGELADGMGTASMARLTYHSLYSVDPVCRPTWWDITCAPLAQTATLSPLDFNQDGVADGNGIVLVINGEPFFMKMAALPASGTKWHLRAVGGRGMNATCTPALPASRTAEMITPPSSCSGYSYQPTNPHRFPLAPGLQYKIRVTQGFAIADTTGDLSGIHTVPDPYYVTNPLEITANTKVLRFVNLPDRAIIRIYSASGILVNIVTHNDQSGGGEEVWNLRNRNNQFVASGVYFYHVETPDGREKIGRFTVVNFAQ